MVNANSYCGVFDNAESNGDEKVCVLIYEFLITTILINNQYFNDIFIQSIHACVVWDLSKYHIKQKVLKYRNV